MVCAEVHCVHCGSRSWHVPEPETPIQVVGRVARAVKVPPPLFDSGADSFDMGWIAAISHFHNELLKELGE